jgi:hypothetical protein
MVTGSVSVSARAAPQHAHRVAEISNRVLNETRPSHVAALLFPLVESAHGQHRFAPGASRRQAARHVLLDLPFEVVAQLLIELAVHRVTVTQRAQAEA